MVATARRAARKTTPAAAPSKVRPLAREEPRRERKRKGGQMADQFELPAEMIAAFRALGMSVEWKRETVTGATFTAYDILLREQGWEPVDGDRFPEFVGEGHRGPIRRDGQVLMERPMELTLEAQAEDRANAREAVAIKEQQLGVAPKDTLQRHRADGSQTGIVQVNRTIESGIPIDS